MQVLQRRCQQRPGQHPTQRQHFNRRTVAAFGCHQGRTIGGYKDPDADHTVSSYVNLRFHVCP